MYYCVYIQSLSEAFNPLGYVAFDIVVGRFLHNWYVFSSARDDSFIPDQNCFVLYFTYYNNTYTVSSGMVIPVTLIGIICFPFPNFILRHIAWHFGWII